MKSLKPSIREKRRYIYVKGHVGDVEKAILDYIGILGMAKASLMWIKRGKDSAIISVNRKMVNDVRAALVVWSENISVERVSGTLKSLREKEKL